MWLLDTLATHARQQPERVALISETSTLSYHQLWQAVTELSLQLSQARIKHIGILLENQPQWLVVQLAAFHSGIPLTPIPTFFTHEQQRHLLQTSGIDLLFAPLSVAQSLQPQFRYQTIINGAGYNPNAVEATLPSQTALVTFTSGTTEKPKGVSLSAESLDDVCQSLFAATTVLGIEQHLCLMPLAILLENLAGALLPLASGKTVRLLSANTTGIGGSGAGQLDMMALANCLNTYQPDSLILTPQLLKVLVGLAVRGLLNHRPTFMAVGGSRVATKLLEQAQALGLSVFEGYGLSECTSVVSLNLPGQYRPGSVGKPLDHCRLTIADDGEILVSGSTYQGYLNHSLPTATTVATGDLGYLDDDGYLFIHGRKKHVLITSQSRNLSPEWLEAELMALPGIHQACVFGDGEDFVSAILSLLPSATETEVTAAIHSLNSTLPDYAHIREWIIASTPFTTTNDQLTSNGRPKRTAIHQAYRAQLDALYQPLTRSHYR